MSARGVEAPEDDDVPTTSGQQQQDGIVFVLENASLETAHVGKVAVIITSTHSFYAACRSCHITASQDVAAAAAGPMLTVVLAVVLQTYQLLNCDDHGRYLGRNGKDPADYRPDICHQVGL